MKQYRNRWRCLTGSLLLTIFFTGCGGKQENLAAGIQAIKDLDYQGAVEKFEEALSLGEDSRQVARGMGIAYMGMADYEQAALYFEEALSLSLGVVESVDYDINYYLAAAYTKGNRYNEAEAVYDSILALKENEKEAYFLRGNIRLELFRYEDAKGDFDKAIGLNPKDFDQLIQIFEVLNNHGYKEAGQLYLQTAMQNYEAQMSAYDKGRIYFYLEEYQQACLALEMAREKGGAEAYIYLGKAYEATGDYNYASSVYQSYISAQGAHAQMYNQLGLCELKKGDYQKALEAFQAGIQVEPNDILQTLSFNEIVAYEYLGDYKKAAVFLESYLNTYPDDFVAQREYGFLNTR
ncbi:tetratricopeptide repeat protein [Lachnospiraceae bacterium OttesenSCG-928-D06]|nr:tetratricopeptide repeat protein [Lachnospiraceae bacterium OttesenSCG-928-D06]